MALRGPTVGASSFASLTSGYDVGFSGGFEKRSQPVEGFARKGRLVDVIVNVIGWVCLSVCVCVYCESIYMYTI